MVKPQCVRRRPLIWLEVFNSVARFSHRACSRRSFSRLNGCRKACQRVHQRFVEKPKLCWIVFRTVLDALQMVEESHRSTLEVFYLGDLSHNEISAALGVPIGTVMSRLSRGKEQLRRALTIGLKGDPQEIPIPKNLGPGGLR